MRHLVIFIIAAVILLYQAGKPFWGHHDFNNAFYGNMARNLVRLPIQETKFGQPLNPGFHTHHPPLLVWSLAGSYLVLGVSEASTRAVPVIFSALTVAFFYGLIKKITDGRTAVIASVFWLVTPIFFYFGKMAVQEILVLFFFVFSFWTYFFAPKLLLPALFLGALSGWPGYYTPVIIFLFDRKKWPLLTVLPLAFGLQLFHNRILTGSATGGGFGEAFSLRSSSIALLPYLKKETAWIVAYFTKPLVLLAAIGLLTVRNWLLFLFLIFGLAHPVLFRQAAERHDYLIYYLLPFMAFAGALVIRRWSYLAPVAVIAMVLTSYRFTGALLASDYDREAVLLGRQAKANQTAEIYNSKILNNSEPQLLFYADKKVIVRPNL